jgi:hypothetical protein
MEKEEGGRNQKKPMERARRITPQQARKLAELSRGAQQQLPGVKKQSDGKKIMTRARKGGREALPLRGSFAVQQQLLGMEKRSDGEK